tara:strand:+ start:171 stop:407 length:237 start_codon:yes stop_codon:yes gene_type:complete
MEVRRQSPNIAGQVKQATSFGSVAQFDIVEIGQVLQAPTLTTTERNALTASNGWIIYNTTDNQLQVYKGGAWVNITTS